jgi:hypothetical protein
MVTVTLPRHRLLERMRARARSRGAALVEAAIVLPVMVIFLGVMQFAYAASSVTMETQRAAGRDALYVASHGCSDGTAVPSGSDLTAPAPAPRQGDRDEPGKNAALDVRQMEVKRTLTASATGGRYSRVVTRSATFACNPRPYTESAPAWFDWGFEHDRGRAP